MPLVRRFALVLGVIYLLVGLLGFVPPLLRGHEHLTGVHGPFEGHLLGIFAVNWFHSVFHLLIGIAGLAAYRSVPASRTYALVVGIAYAVIFVLGISTAHVGTLGGLLPLNVADDVLHFLTAAVALAVYAISRAPAPAPTTVEPRT